MFSIFRPVFQFVGGYAVADFYASAIRIDRDLQVDADYREQRSWLFFRARPSPATEGLLDAYDVDTVRGDLTELIAANPVASLATVMTVVAGGGPVAVLGAVAAAALDGQEGRERYLMIKDQVLDVLGK